MTSDDWTTLLALACMVAPLLLWAALGLPGVDRFQRWRCSKVGHDLGPRRVQPSGRVWRYCFRCGRAFCVHDPRGDR